MKTPPRSVASWLWLLGGIVSVATLVALTSRLSASSGPTDAADRFSTDRAMHIVRRLCDEIGRRPNGTPAHARAAEMLAEELRTIPGVEVELQHPSGVQRYKAPPWPFPPIIYRTTNVVARLAGRTQEALLLNAHFDTTAESVGAGDDALGVAVMVETLRALAAGPKPEHSIVVNLNGLEEMGSLGAAGFLQHRFAKDVRAYLYIDSGPRGRTFVVGTGPRNAWLLKEYARASGATYTSVIGEDLLGSGMLPHSGDFLPFHEAGLVGIDLGAVDDFWSVHTDRDTSSHLDRPTMQSMGDNLLAAAQGLANGPLPGNVDSTRYVYYDLLGFFVPIYKASTARALALVGLALAVFALVLAIRRKALSLRQILGAFGRLLVIELAVILAAALVAVLLAFVLGRPHGWFSHPALALWTFGAASVAAGFAILAWRRRRRPDEPELAAWAGGLCFWSLLLALATYAGAGCGYIPLWWASGIAVGLLGALLLPKWRGAWWLLSFLPGCLLVVNFYAQIFPFLIADIGLVPAPMPLDIVVSLLVALAILFLMPSILAVVEVSARLGRLSLGCALLALTGMIVTALANPYSVERPKRMRASLIAQEGSSGVFLASHDAPPLGPALRDVPAATPLKSKWSPLGPMDAVYSYSLPAANPSFPAPVINVLSSSYDPARNVRTVKVRLESDWPQLRFFIPRAAFRGWSLGAAPQVFPEATRFPAMFEDPAPEDKELTLELAGSDPVEVELIVMRGPSTAPEISELAKKLPPWTAFDSMEMGLVKRKI